MFWLGAIVCLAGIIFGVYTLVLMLREAIQSRKCPCGGSYISSDWQLDWCPKCRKYKGEDTPSDYKPSVFG